MLERLAPTKVLLTGPKNKKMKRFIESSVAANGPMFESLVKRVGRHKDVTLVIDSMLKQSLKFGIRMPKNLLLFAREAAIAWDSFSSEERAKAGLGSELCRNISPASTFFSNIRRSSNSFAAILDGAEDKEGMVKRWKLLMGLRQGKVPFEKVQEFFLNEAKEEIELYKFHITEERIELFGEGKIKLMYMNIHSKISQYEEMLAELKKEAAIRLIVGYSPAL